MFLMNNILFGRLFRRLLGVKDIPLSLKITHIDPSTVHYEIERGTYKSRHYGYPHYAAKLYFSFYFLIWAMHYLDSLLLDKYVPQYSFGFDVLNAYSDEGAGDHVDGVTSYFYGSEGLTWDTLISRIGTGVNYASNSTIAVNVQAAIYTSKWVGIFRGTACFDTSLITEFRTVTSAKFYGFDAYRQYQLNPEERLVVCGKNKTNYNEITILDHTNNYSIEFGSVLLSSFADGGSFIINFNQSGIEYINKTGGTALGFKLGSDFDEIEPAWLPNSRNQVFFSSSGAPQGYTPCYLEITFTTSEQQKQQMIV